MSSKLVLWNAVIAKLTAAQASGHPLAYVKNVYDGIYPKLDDLPPQSFPAIMLEPDEDDEKWFATGVPPAISSEFRIFATCLVREAKFNKGISGDTGVNASYVGILQFADDVKNVLQADQTLGGVAGLQKLAFPKTVFFFEGYPIREAKISVQLTSQLTATSH